MEENYLKVKLKECYENVHTNALAVGNKTVCGKIFDGILCWPDTEAGATAFQPCPDFLFKTYSRQMASKTCGADGKWFVSKEVNQIWTNYSQCWKLVDSKTAVVNRTTQMEYLFLYQTWLPVIKTVSHVGYGVSLAALFLAIAIFVAVKKLGCAKNILHVHLFVSFVMRAFMYLLKDWLFVDGLALSSDVYLDEVAYMRENYSWICKAITSAWHYFIMANYMFILMEGLYLHNLMFLAVFYDNNNVALYYLSGWGLPVFFIVPWVVLRINFEDTICWTTNDNYYYPMLIQLPIIISIITNFLLFVLIVRVLFVKLNSIHMQQRKMKYRRFARSTLILIPLFGVAYTLSVIMYYTTTTDPIFELIWIFFDQTISAFQGLLVVFIYCVLNGDIRSEIARKYNHLRARARKNKKRTTSNSQHFPMQEFNTLQNN